MREVTPSLLTRLASVKLTLKGMLAEVEAIEGELRRREEEEKQKLSLPAAEWLSLDDAVKFLPGFKTREAFRQWAKVHGIEARKVGNSDSAERPSIPAKPYSQSTSVATNPDKTLPDHGLQDHKIIPITLFTLNNFWTEEEAALDTIEALSEEDTHV